MTTALLSDLLFIHTSIGFLNNNTINYSKLEKGRFFYRTALKLPEG